MYKVRVKRFLDTEQVQIYEQVGRREVKSDFEKEYLIQNSKGKKRNKGGLIENPFNDNHLEWATEIQEKDRSDSIKASRSRTIKKVYDISRANEWEWFVALTFNPEKVDSYNYPDVTKKLSKWLNNIKSKCPDMKYIVVPEQHPTSGRWHFHGLFSNVDNLDITFSGHYDKNGSQVYNFGKYNLGWSHATKVRDTRKVSGYILKYVTKDLCSKTAGKKRYWASRNCDLPEVIDYDVEMKLEDILLCCDIGNSYMQTKEGYLTVTYIDAPIYSTNTVRFVEREVNLSLPDSPFDSLD